MTPSDVDAAASGDDADVRRLHPLTPFFDLILLARQFAFPLVVALFANRDRGQALLAVPAVLGSVGQLARWLRFTYVLDGGRFVISEGVFTRKQRVVPLDRIQQVDTEARLRHRLFGVVVLKIDTSGGVGGAEVNLSVVSRSEAERLRRLLLTAAPAAVGNEPHLEGGEHGVAAGDEPQREERPLVRLGFRRLMLAGITGSELAVMVTIVTWPLQVIDNLAEDLFESQVRGIGPPSGIAGYVLAAGLLVTLWLGLAAAASVVKNGNYALTRRGEDLHVSRGLLDRREVSVPSHRVQTARIHEPILRRLLRMGGVRFRSTAGSLDVPLLTRVEWRALLDEVLPGERPEALTPAPTAARRRAWTRRLVPATILAVAGAWWRPDLRFLAPVLLVVAMVSGELAYRGLGHGWRGGFVVAREGGLRRETFVVPSAKAQSTRLRTSPFQRRAGLATLWIDVAGGGSMPVIRDGDAEALARLQAEVLSEAARLDEDAVRRATRPA